MESSVLCPYFPVDKAWLPKQHFIRDKPPCSTLTTFQHLYLCIKPLGSSYGFVDFPMPVTLQGFSYHRILLIPIYHTYVCTNISISRGPRTFGTSSVLVHILTIGIFIDLRTIDCTIHLWTGFPFLAR